MQSEIQLFLIWEKAYPKLPEIAEDISNEFKVIKNMEVEWSKDKFAENLTQFYGTKLPPNSFKEKHCGNGTFTVFIVEDNSPIYENRKTSKGSQIVNSKMFDLKTKYRSWTGGGHKIHATNSIKETEHDIMLLFGKTLPEIVNEEWGEALSQEYVKMDVQGANGWENLNHLFTVLNETVDYVVLRNFEDLSTELVSGDIDILTNNIDEFKFITKAEKIYSNNRRVAYFIKVGPENIYFDIRCVGDNYYDNSWQTSILNNKVKNDDGFFIPNNEEYFYSLMYHGLIHKPKLSDVYHSRLLELSKLLSENIHSSKNGEKQWIDILFKFIKQNDYTYTIPKDYSVYFNYENAPFFEKDMTTQFIKWARTKLISLKQKF